MTDLEGVAVVSIGQETNRIIDNPSNPFEESTKKVGKQDHQKDGTVICDDDASDPSENISRKEGNDDSNDNECDEEETTLQTTNGVPPPMSDGKFFAYVATVVVVENFVLFMWLLALRLSGYGWSRLPVATLHGKKEIKQEEFAISIILDIHSFVAIAAIVLAVIQTFSTFFFAGQDSTKNRDPVVRKVHRWNGRFLFTLWMFCTLTGFAYTLAASYNGHFSDDETLVKGIYVSFFWWAGVAILINGFIGYRAIAHKPQEEDRNYLLHKAGMCFILFWGLSAGAPIFAVAAIQSFLPDCLVDGIITPFFQVGGLGGQLLVFVGTLFWYDRTLWKLGIVRVNVYAYGVFVGYFLGVGVVALLSPVPTPEEEGVTLCWT